MLALEGTLIAALALLAVLAGLAIRLRLLRRTGRMGPMLSDEDVRHIEEVGSLARDDDEPLDLDEVREAEERFWQEEDW